MGLRLRRDGVAHRGPRVGNEPVRRPRGAAGAPEGEGKEGRDGDRRTERDAEDPGRHDRGW